MPQSAISVTAVAAGPDGDTVLVGYRDGTIRQWNWRSGTTDFVYVLQAEGYPDWIHVLGGGTLLCLFTSFGAPSTLLSIGPDGEENWRGHIEGRKAAVIKDRSELLVPNGQTVLRLDVVTGDVVEELGPFRHRAADAPISMRALAASADGSMFATESDDIVSIIGAGSDKIIRAFNPGYRATYLSMSPDGATLAASSDERFEIEIFDPNSGRSAAILKGHDDTAWNPTFSESGAMLATFGQDKSAIVWNVADLSMKWRLPTHTDGHSEGAFLAGERVLASAVGDGSVRVWSLDDGREMVALFALYRGEGPGIAVLPDGRFSGPAEGVAITHDESGTPQPMTAEIYAERHVGDSLGEILASAARN